MNLLTLEQKARKISDEKLWLEIYDLPQSYLFPNIWVALDELKDRYFAMLAILELPK